MKIMKTEDYYNLKNQIKQLIDENIKLKGEIYSLKRQLNFANFRADDFKGLMFPNTDERGLNGEPETPDFSDF